MLVQPRLADQHRNRRAQAHGAAQREAPIIPHRLGHDAWQSTRDSGGGRRVTAGVATHCRLRDTIAGEKPQFQKQDERRRTAYRHCPGKRTPAPPRDGEKQSCADSQRPYNGLVGEIGDAECTVEGKWLVIAERDPLYWTELESA
jgi:hypothetical protein